MAEKNSIIRDYKSDEATCLQLAIEGQRLCRNGDVKIGIHFFENALMRGTDDLNILTVVYSQLGNAYFSLREYNKSLHFHRLDLDLSRRLNDSSGEAKACGNLGNTLKMLGKYDEAVACCELHLKISRKLTDKPGVARALYNLANIYHQKAKASGAIGRQDLGQFPHHIQDALEKAAKYYEENLELCKEIDDRATQGLSCGNLANTHYLLGNFQRAVELHTERLIIAKEFGHRAAERRAYSNRGNAYIFLANFELAIEDYRCALQLARELNDETLEAQVCYSLGNTYYILRRYDDAAVCLEQHLRIAKKLVDKVGEARAYWSLTNIHSDNGDYHRAKFYASLHLQIASELDDSLEVTTAKDNLLKLDVLIERTENGLNESDVNISKIDGDSTKTSSKSSNNNNNTNCEVMNVLLNRHVGGSLKIGTSTSNNNNNNGNNTTAIIKSCSHGNMTSSGGGLDSRNDEDDDFFSLLSKFQSRRMDEQRCSMREDEDEIENDFEEDEGMSEAQSEFLELVAGVQGSRMNDQRAAVPPEFPGLRATPAVLTRLMEADDLVDGIGGPSEALLEMIARCQASRIDDQRSSLLPPPIIESATGGQLDTPNSNSTNSNTNHSGIQRTSTVPDEDLMALIQRLSSYRLDEQRCSPPFPLPALTLAGPAPITNSVNVVINRVVDDADGVPEPSTPISPYDNDAAPVSSNIGSRRRR